ncbi:unnamed protein product [marine sediment metagenome]|uniref:Uncharacterized protein n=1 Tax=marine sediment metagenome TaxID=412755 RepID=X1G0V9_9ZZZZ
MHIQTLEDCYYMEKFNKKYSVIRDIIPYKWLPQWCGDVKDSSASVLKVYDSK